MRSVKRIAVLYALLTGLLYGLIGSAQILGFLKLYQLWLVVPLALILSAGLTWGYLRWGGKDFFQAILQDEMAASGSLLDRSLLLAGLLLTIALIVWPVALWPKTPISETLHWDAGVYHLPKALEMVRTGSSWDMSISYGEYPYGYESLFSFAALLTKDGALFGAAHLLTCLYFLFNLWLLLRRMTGLPSGASLFLSSFLLLSGFFSEIDSNLWWIYKPLLYTIGKNDLFLGAAILAVILHAPVGRRENQKAFHLFGLGAATMIAVSVKPNSMLVVLAAWAWTLLVMAWKQRSLMVKPILGALLVALPGGLWALRNLLAQGQIFSAGVLSLNQGSIASNLTNPYFYQNIPQDLIRVCLIFVISVVVAVFVKHVPWPVVVTFGLLLLGFAITPASAYPGVPDTPPGIAWRFALAALAFTFLLPVIWLSPLVNRLYTWVARFFILQGLVAILVLAFSGWFIWSKRRVLTLNPANAIVLQDQFRSSVGVHGYHSAYDYVHRNVRDSIIWVENGLSYYAYGPGFTNSTTRSRKADYEVVFQTAWTGGDPAYPEFLKDPAWQANWKLVYEDSEGRVYQRIGQK